VYDDDRRRLRDNRRMRAIVRRRIVRVFRQLEESDWDAVVAGLAPDVHHVFPGRHPLGGERHDREAARRWFERLGRLYPGHDFRVQRVAVAGPPWRMSVAVQWTATLRPASGEPYENEGAHWLAIRWGRVTAFHAYLDTQRIAAACEAMAREGIAEAAAAPIVS
jgi:ketosteroid isomerase-like protein